MNQNRLRDLNEDLARLGLPDGIDMKLAGLRESEEGPKGTFSARTKVEARAESKKDNAVAMRIAERAYNVIRGSIEESEIDYDVDQFEHDLAKALLALAERAVEEGEDEAEITDQIIAEAFKKIRSLAPGGPKMKKIKVLRGSEMLMARRERKMNRAARKKSQKKWARSAAGKKYKVRLARANKKARASGKMESHAAASMLALLGESDEASLSAVGRELDEAYFRVFSTAAALSDFFEEHGEQGDGQISDALCTMIESMDGDVSSLVEGDGGDLAGRLKRLQTWGKIVSEAIEVFETYSMDDEDEYDDDEDEDEDEDEGND
jgi:hypothetical protein